MGNLETEAFEYIGQVHRSIPLDASLSERRAALQERAIFFHHGRAQGKKVWAKAVRKYLETHGQPCKRLLRRIQKRQEECDANPS